MANLFAALDLNRTGTVDVKEFFASLLCTMEPENQVGCLPVSQLELEYLQLSAKQFLVPFPLCCYTLLAAAAAVPTPCFASAAAAQIAFARRSFRQLDREQSGFLTQRVFVDEMVRQAVISGMPREDALQLENELEAEFR